MRRSWLFACSALRFRDGLNQAACLEDLDERGDIGDEIAYGRVVLEGQHLCNLDRGVRRVELLPDPRGHFVQRVDTFEVANAARNRDDDRFGADAARDKR